MQARASQQPATRRQSATPRDADYPAEVRGQGDTASAKSRLTKSEKQSLLRVQSACVRASQAITVATQQTVTSEEDRAQLIGWARNSAIAALEALDSSDFWPVFKRNAESGGAPSVPSPELVGQLKDVLSDELIRVLMEAGYRPPPPAGDLVLDARMALTYVLSGPAEPNIRAAQEKVAALHQALESLMGGRPSRAKKVLAKSRRSFVAIALACGVLAGDVGQGLAGEYAAEYAGQIIERFSFDNALEDGSDEPATVEELEIALLRAQLREAEARAEAAERSLRDSP